MTSQIQSIKEFDCKGLEILFDRYLTRVSIESRKKTIICDIHFQAILDLQFNLSKCEASTFIKSKMFKLYTLRLMRKVFFQYMDHFT